MRHLSIRAVLALVLLLPAGPLAAQEEDPSILSIERIFGSDEFRNQRFGPARWLEGGDAYTTLEPSPDLE